MLQYLSCYLFILSRGLWKSSIFQVTLMQRPLTYKVVALSDELLWPCFPHRRSVSSHGFTETEVAPLIQTWNKRPVCSDCKSIAILTFTQCCSFYSHKQHVYRLLPLIYWPSVYICLMTSLFCYARCRNWMHNYNCYLNSTIKFFTWILFAAKYGGKKITK